MKTLYSLTGVAALTLAFLLPSQDLDRGGDTGRPEDGFNLKDVPTPDPIDIKEPDIIAYPGDDINKIVRDNAYGGELFVLGILGKHNDSLRLCKKYGAHTQDEGDLVIQVVGIHTDIPAEIRGIHFYDERGRVKSAEFHNLRVSTSKGARSPILDIARSERLVFNSLEFYPDPDNLDQYGGAGMKWGFDLGSGS